MKEGNIDNFYLKTFMIVVASTLIGLLGIHLFELILILFPVLFITNSINDGIGEGITNMIVTLIIIAFVESPEAGIILAITFIPFTLVISYLIKNRKGNLNIIGISSLTFFASMLAMLLIVNFIGVDVLTFIENTFQGLIDSQLKSLENMGLSNLEFFRLKEMLKETYKYLLLVIPSIILMLSALVSYINYSLSGIILDKLGIKLINLPKLSKIRLPDNIILGSMIMFLITFLSGQLGFIYYKTVFINITALISMGLFIQGFSVMDYLLNKFNFNIIFKIILYIMFIFNSGFASIITIVGLVDLIFDFRKLKKKTKKD